MFTIAEEQLITSLAWFKSRYALFLGLDPERKADRKSIEDFGEIWIGNFKEDWTNTFSTLVQKNVLKHISEEYTFTDYGNTVKNEMNAKVPFYKFEYDNFFYLVKQSKAHSIFCEKVYGLDLSQHGLIDQGELSILIEMIKKSKSKKIADIGCGNGKITEYISEQTQTNCLGIDISSEGIQNAKERTVANKQLEFAVGNLNNLQLSGTFDSILFLDTLYYADSLKETIIQGIEILAKGGRIFAYFSQWIMDESFSDNLKYDKTNLGNVLNELNLEYSAISLSESGKKHWKRKLEVLMDMKKDFFDEGNQALWEFRFRETYRYANWGDDKYARYLYEIRKQNKQ
ncbi:MAG: class I SAM-dependent methyltransferase [Flavobacteriaceae bacterium]|nr:class I SAM-dependent methyltransferase [Flavobacteriaceae bacterium]